MFCEIVWALILWFTLHRLHADPPRLKLGSSVAHQRVAAEQNADRAREPHQLGENLPAHGGSSYAAASRLFANHPARAFGPESPNS
jgi:hypothetical protein